MPLAVLQSPSTLSLAELFAPLSCALDLSEGQPEGHAARTAMIGMRISQEIYLSKKQRAALFYTLLLKDLGSSANASQLCTLLAASDHSAKSDLKTANWSSAAGKLSFLFRNVAPGSKFLTRFRKIIHVTSAGNPAAKDLIQLRSDRGASIVRQLQLPEETAVAIRSLDELWNGRGFPQNLLGEDIPILARIAGLAQTVEVFHRTLGLSAAFDIARFRSNSWFDPQLVKALCSLESDKPFWNTLRAPDPLAAVLAFEPESQFATATEDHLDRIAAGFSQVIDAKSPWTFRHSESVADIAVGIAQVLNFSPHHTRQLRRAALLHDIGKLAISNLLLDKPGKLTPVETALMQKHPYHTHELLSRTPAFREIAPLAAAHHERLDGAGYPLGLSAKQLTLSARILTLADTFEALAARRPYRQDLTEDEVTTILIRNLGTALDPTCYEGLQAYLQKAPFIPVSLAA